MSQARIYTVQRARKAQGKCQKCGLEILPGMPYSFFILGFRSKLKRIRCHKSSCIPTRAERESSKLADMYAAIDDADFNSCETLDDIQSILNEVAEVATELANEYAEASVNQNTGAVFNTDAEERGQNLEAYADTLTSWESEEPEPEEPDETEGWDLEEHEGKIFEEAHKEWEEDHDTWLEAAKESAQDALNEEDF